MPKGAAAQILPSEPAEAGLGAPEAPARLGPPLARKEPHEVELWGVRLVDDYAWLKAPNWKEVLKDSSLLPAEIAAYLEAENAFTDAALADLAPLRAELVAEMRARIKEDDSTVPRPDGPFSYYQRHREGGQHRLICRIPREGGAEEVLLDGDAEAEGLAYFDLAEATHSPDHRLLAWSADVTGAELHTIRIRDLATGLDLPDTIRGSAGAVVWAADSRALYYVEVDDNHRPVRVRRHVLGDVGEDAHDETIYEEPDPGWFVGIDLTTSRRLLAITASDHESSEVWLVDLASGEPPRLVAPRRPQVLYAVDDHGADIVVRTNADGAEDFKLVLAPLAEPGPEGWRDLVPHRPGIMVLFHAAFARFLVRLEREDANPRIVVRDWASGAEHEIAFAEEAFSLGFDAGYEYDTDTLRYTYSSLTTPHEVWDYDLVSREHVLRKREEVPSGFDSGRYVTRRIFATAPDGETVPISLVHRADLVRDGSAPCLLYGYGSYGSAMAASFRTNLFSLVDRGFVYAIAHVRGGTERGWRWYLDGKREKKPNTFTDFVACADALVAAGLTGRGRIVALGGSAGGLLMGAVANIAGERFAGIVADVPFVDALNTMLDAELPLTPPEWPEWGNPIENEQDFRSILAYSPYENVRPQRYPAVLALGGLTDPRVTYWEPAKWVAKLRATMTGGGPVYLRINMEAGHGGAAGRFDRLDEVALIYAFALRAVGMA